MGKRMKKCVMIGVFVVFCAYGGSMLGVGLRLAADSSARDSIQASRLNVVMWDAVGYTIVGMGAGIILTGILGCYGALKGIEGPINTKLHWCRYLLTFMIGLAVFAVFALFIFSGSQISGIEREEHMTADVKQNYTGPYATDGFSVSWNKMQYQWECCGSQNFTDYRNSKYATFDAPVPYTCCVYKAGSPSYDQKSSVENYAECMSEARHYNYLAGSTFKHLNARGCYEQAKNFFYQKVIIIAGAMGIVTFLQILSIIVNCCCFLTDKHQI